MTHSQTPNTQNQAKPNNLSAVDKKIADGKAAEQRQPDMQTPADKQKQMQGQAEGKPIQHGSDSPAVQHGDTTKT